MYNTYKMFNLVLDNVNRGILDTELLVFREGDMNEMYPNIYGNSTSECCIPEFFDLSKRDYILITDNNIYFKHEDNTLYDLDTKIEENLLWVPYPIILSPIVEDKEDRNKELVELGYSNLIDDINYIIEADLPLEDIAVNICTVDNDMVNCIMCDGRCISFKGSVMDNKIIPQELIEHSSRSPHRFTYTKSMLENIQKELRDNLQQKSIERLAAVREVGKIIYENAYQPKHNRIYNMMVNVFNSLMY